MPANKKPGPASAQETPPPEFEEDHAASSEAGFPGGAFWDDLAQLAAGAGQAAEAAGMEARHLWQSQMEALKRRLDLVPRESFDAVAETASKALEKIAALEARIAALEANAGKSEGKSEGRGKESGKP